MNDTQERNNRVTGMVVSIGIHAGLIGLFFFILAWREPYPPAPEYGIELNFGTEEPGTGTIQPETISESDLPESTGQDEPVEENAKSQEPLPGEQDGEVKDNTDSREENSPDKLENEKIKEQVEKVDSEQKSNKQNTTANTAESKVTDKKSQGAESDTEQNTSQGDQQNAAGDQGNPEGTIDARSLYGTPGGGDDGPKLDMAGWEWDFLSKPVENSNEKGQIVFEIKIDDQGEVISVKRISGSVSPAVEKVYRDSLYKSTFKQTDNSSLPSLVSTGTVTFIIRSK